MKDPFSALPPEARGSLREQRQPRWVDPMLATLTDERFSDSGWIFERKLDGVRCLAFRAGDRLRILSRNQKTLNETYPELVEALEQERRDDFIVDGEIVAFRGGVTSFAQLQGRMQVKSAAKARRSGIAVYLYLFDVLHLDGYDTTRLAQRDRKGLLRRALTFHGHVRFTPHRNAEGESYLADACRKGWEGLIAKRADAPYVHKRSRDWLKLKCSAGQEFVIAGYTEPTGAREAFGALLLGYHQGGELRYAGRVGTGFDSQLLRTLGRKLEGRERRSSPLREQDAREAGGASVHWVRPELVAEIGFTEWTKAGRLRHPRFLGLRDDKDPRDILRERPRGGS